LGVSTSFPNKPPLDFFEQRVYNCNINKGLFMKKILIVIVVSIIVSCASSQYVDVAIEEAAWSTLEVLENVTDKTLAVYYFTSTDEEIEKGLSDYLRQGLTTEIANALMFEELDIKVISRQALDQLMKEQSFQLSDLVDEGTQVEIGKLLGADLIITGQLTWIDVDNRHLNAQIIEVETGIVLGGFVYDFWVETE
jgi:curli biogenesis system outer membrane secretion channel CsgG